MELKLIDVSVYQGNIDWAKVKPYIDGAIIRCGFGGDYAKQDDSKFKRNVEGCIANNIPFGIYLYSYAKDIASAKSEAAHVLRLINPYKDKISYPVYLDLEEAGTQNGAVDRALVFGNIIESAGYWCGIYANEYWWRTYLKSGLDRYTKWVAKYSTAKPNGISGTYDMWQYSSKGSVPGISGNVDMNICYRDLVSAIKGKSVKEEPKEDAKEDKQYTKEQFIRDVQAAIGAKVDGIAGPETISKTVTVSAKKNQKHKVVPAIQRWLNENGYNCGDVDGIAGPKFTAAVKDFQKANSCVSDGEITSRNKTWHKLLGMD